MSRPPARRLAHDSARVQRKLGGLKLKPMLAMGHIKSRNIPPRGELRQAFLLAMVQRQTGSRRGELSQITQQEHSLPSAQRMPASQPLPAPSFTGRARPAFGSGKDGCSKGGGGVGGYHGGYASDGGHHGNGPGSHGGGGQYDGVA